MTSLWRMHAFFLKNKRTWLRSTNGTCCFIFILPGPVKAVVTLLPHILAHLLLATMLICIFSCELHH